MKRVFYLMNIVLLAGLLSASCSKDKDNTDNFSVEEEVADDIAASLGSSNSGISSEIVEVAVLADENSSLLKSATLDTIYSVDTTFTRKNATGAKITYNYSYQLEYGIILGSPDKLYYDGVASGTYESPRISSTDSRTSNWDLTGLEASSSSYVLNGSIERTGNSVSKVRNKSQTSSDAQIALSNVKVNKSTLSITEGTLTWSTTGKVNAKSYNYNVTVVYLGNGNAELTINGVKYTVDISSGEIE